MPVVLWERLEPGTDHLDSLAPRYGVDTVLLCRCSEILDTLILFPVGGRNKNLHGHLRWFVLHILLKWWSPIKSRPMPYLRRRTSGPDGSAAKSQAVTDFVTRLACRRHLDMLQVLRLQKLTQQYEIFGRIIRWSKPVSWRSRHGYCCRRFAAQTVRRLCLPARSGRQGLLRLRPGPYRRRSSPARPAAHSKDCGHRSRYLPD